jgi:hypothetical protein
MSEEGEAAPVEAPIDSEGNVSNTDGHALEAPESVQTTEESLVADGHSTVADGGDADTVEVADSTDSPVVQVSAAEDGETAAADAEALPADGNGVEASEQVDHKEESLTTAEDAVEVASATNADETQEAEAVVGGADDAADAALATAPADDISVKTAVEVADPILAAEPQAEVAAPDTHSIAAPVKTRGSAQFVAPSSIPNHFIFVTSWHVPSCGSDPQRRASLLHACTGC